MKKIIIIMTYMMMSFIATSQVTPNIPKGATLTASCEYGNKGVKLSILAFIDKSARNYIVIENTELNIAPGKSVNVADGMIPTKEVKSIVGTTVDAFTKFYQKYIPLGLKDEKIKYYASSGMALIQNMAEFTDSVKSMTGKKLYIVGADEEAKYTVAGTIPFEKIDRAIVIDQGSGNSKGGCVIVEGNELTITPFSFDLGSTSVYNLITSQYMQGTPDDPRERRLQFIAAMNKCFDSIKPIIRNTLENIEGAQGRNELYISGGAAFIITTLLYPENDQKEQLVEINYNTLIAFLTNIQEKEYYDKLYEKVFTNSTLEKNYKKALKIYNEYQLISATKLLVTDVNSLTASNKKIFFNTYGLHAMTATLLGRYLRGEIKNW